ncbi:MAG: peptide chain release factor-like protein [Phycisphaerae bacterium]|jgi:hypothetical protein|nr:peptide chain release factor-like protein [Phycisphaerae bacterium]HJN71186.1 peptide chain release factor-like protein [Phycisphaerales bacterium]|tara:strand:+ start:591 stop:1196 length:606 start_codon:yes stop_codon:yes gene_type:complete
MRTTNTNKNGRRNQTALPPIEDFIPKGHRFIEGDHPAMMSEENLLKEVSLSFGRTGGPGGQHRNRKATACTATHVPTDITGTATERRRQSENRTLSVSRLRRTLAIILRRKIDTRKWTCSDLWRERQQGEQLPINPKHRDYPHLLAESLDLLFAFDFDLAATAACASLSSSQIVKLIAHDKQALAWVNEQREERDLSPLKS